MKVKIKIKSIPTTPHDNDDNPGKNESYNDDDVGNFDDNFHKVTLYQTTIVAKSSVLYLAHEISTKKA